MLNRLKNGFGAAWREPFLLFALFLYRFAWGFFLYRLITATLIPLLHRYPAENASPGEIRMFLIEAEIRMSRTDIVSEYLWGLLAVLALRMVLTPLLQAGIFYSLTHKQTGAGYRFFKGMKAEGGSFFLLYATRLLLTLLPVYLLLPKLAPLASDLTLMSENKWTLLAYGVGFLIYGYLLYLLLLHLQFGKTYGQGLASTLVGTLGTLFPVIGAAALLIGLSVLLSGAVLATVLINASFWTFVLYQAYQFVRCFFSLWAITTQQVLFDERLEAK
jgi:hypothetical protein